MNYKYSIVTLFFITFLSMQAMDNPSLPNFDECVDLVITDCKQNRVTIESMRALETIADLVSENTNQPSYTVFQQLNLAPMLSSFQNEHPKALNIYVPKHPNSENFCYTVHNLTKFRYVQGKLAQHNPSVAYSNNDIRLFSNMKDDQLDANKQRYRKYGGGGKINLSHKEWENDFLADLLEQEICLRNNTKNIIKAPLQIIALARSLEQTPQQPISLTTNTENNSPQNEQSAIPTQENSEFIADNQKKPQALQQTPSMAETLPQAQEPNEQQEDTPTTPQEQTQSDNTQDNTVIIADTDNDKMAQMTQQTLSIIEKTSQPDTSSKQQESTPTISQEPKTQPQEKAFATPFYKKPLFVGLSLFTLFALYCSKYCDKEILTNFLNNPQSALTYLRTLLSPTAT